MAEGCGAAEPSQERVPVVAACAPLQEHSSAGLDVTHTGRASLNSSGPAVLERGEVEDILEEGRSETYHSAQ